MSKSKPSKHGSSLKQKSLLDYYETTISKIAINEIQINKRIRSKPNQTQIESLAESINKIGLLNPITITKNKILVAGYHRLHACKHLGWSEIPCVITTVDNSLLLELQEIDENLIRYELHFIDRGNHLKRRKEIYEILNPETKKGVAGGIASGISRSKGTTAPSAIVQKKSFVEATIIKTGFSERKINEDIQIATDIIPEVQEFIIEKEITKKDALKIARMPADEQIKIKEKIEKGNKKSKFIENVQAQIKKEEKPRLVPDLPKGEYDVIYADPPWKYKGGTTPNRIIENQYPTMDLEKISELKIPSAKNAILFLWVTSPKLEDGLEVIKAWGFIYKTSMVWVKDKIGMGYYARGRHEFLLIATRGQIGVPDPENRPDSVIESPRKRHSKKPEIVYDLLEQMYPEHEYLELFARNKREKWMSWGNEI